MRGVSIAVLCLDCKINCLVDIFYADDRQNRHHKLVLNEIVVKIGLADDATDVLSNVYAYLCEKYVSITANTVTVFPALFVFSSRTIPASVFA